MDKFAVEAALGVLANNMRLYVEAQARFAGLFKIDREEAISNVDRAFEAKLEALHTLYDISQRYFPWFEFGDTSVLIALRNAIHHRNHPLFRSLNLELWLSPGPERWVGAAFLLAKHRVKGEPRGMMEQFYRLEDFRSRLDPDLSSPYLDTFLNEIKARQRYNQVAGHLSFAKIHETGLRERFPPNQIYVDIIPVFVSAVCRIFKALHAEGIEFKGFDAAVYQAAFTTEIQVDLNALVYRTPRLHRL
ncbi:hypothetical protein [Rhizobium sp. CECT 9324]|uniref:hypothetical protein n=1 Tax=Rhizobium sp. CECT 9324 TaxID=2845820 RepID=UPI001E4A37DA|nr:hypothetical protein [Rhizobium sp. CECT 9324]CAH0343561.1 hypothetical protein RHI9324_05298 [Rhizobium sp. CECT 9324]